jgi:hypothetical protein
LFDLLFVVGVVDLDLSAMILECCLGKRKVSAMRTKMAKMDAYGSC